MQKKKKNKKRQIAQRDILTAARIRPGLILSSIQVAQKKDAP